MRTIIIFIILLFLVGCASVPMSTTPLNKNMPWPQRQAELNKLQNWHAQGAIAVRYQQRAQTVNVDLIQQGTNYHLELYGPLGAQRVVLDGTAKNVILKMSDGQIITAQTPEVLLQQKFGWSLPINNFYYWLRGLPAPNLPSKLQFDAYNHLVNLQQQGWVIRYARYAGIKTIDLPTKIILQNNLLRVIIIISQWQLEN